MTHEARNPPPPVTHTLPFSFSVSAAISKTSFQRNDQPPQQVKLLCSSLFLSFFKEGLFVLFLFVCLFLFFVFYFLFIFKFFKRFCQFFSVFFGLKVRTGKGRKDPAHPNLRGPKKKNPSNSLYIFILRVYFENLTI